MNSVANKPLTSKELFDLWDASDIGSWVEFLEETFNISKDDYYSIREALPSDLVSTINTCIARRKAKEFGEQFSSLVEE